MPGFARLGSEALSAIQRYVLTGEETRATMTATASSPIDQRFKAQVARFLDPDGYPAVKPPGARSAPST